MSKASIDAVLLVHSVRGAGTGKCICVQILLCFDYILKAGGLTSVPVFRRHHNLPLMKYYGLEKAILAQ